MKILIFRLAETPIKNKICTVCTTSRVKTESKANTKSKAKHEEVDEKIKEAKWEKNIWYTHMYQTIVMILSISVDFGVALNKYGHDTGKIEKEQNKLSA